VEVLIADAKKAEKNLRWMPKVKFGDLVKIMMDADMRAAGLIPPGEGDEVLMKHFPKKWWSAD
jgi:GDPmannose 4,6-dehydratase